MQNDIHYGSISIERYSELIEFWKECVIKIEPEDSLERLSRFLNSTYSQGFMAEYQGKIVGTALCTGDDRYGYIHHVAVSPKCRHCGIGKKLVEKCKYYITTNLKIEKIVIFVRDSNMDAHAFWSKLGFVKAEGLEVFSIRS